MGNVYKVLIVDDSVHTTTMLTEFFSNKADIEIVGVCEDGIKCIDFLTNHKVDVVLLDMIMPNLDGLGVLEKKELLAEENKPSFILLSTLKNEHMIAKAGELGAKYYMLKPFDNETLYTRIMQVCSSNDEVNQNNATIKTSTSTYNTRSSSSSDEKIASIFLMVGMPAHIKGFSYLKEAVKLVLEDKTMINKITKELYPSIANVFDTSPSKVERAIRHAIEVAWNRGKIENINQVFGYQIYGKNDKPTNGEFIALMADRLSLSQKY